ncbi:MAG TPA: nuclear transport factor 2 family protein [Dongiaceae bacterium]|nr:nuclear transport factor 2 family protein [Dongiaceae bacterium]
MNSKTSLFVALAVLLTIAAVVTGSQGESTPGTASAPEAKQAVLDRLNEIQAAAQALDADKVFSFVTDNDAGVLIQNGRLFPTREAALNSTKRGFQGLRQIRYQFDQQRVALLSPTVALATGEGTSTATIEDGRVITTHFAQSVVLILTNGDWKVCHAHRSFAAAK